MIQTYLENSNIKPKKMFHYVIQQSLIIKTSYQCHVYYILSMKQIIRPDDMF